MYRVDTGARATIIGLANELVGRILCFLEEYRGEFEAFTSTNASLSTDTRISFYNSRTEHKLVHPDCKSTHELLHGVSEVGSLRFIISLPHHRCPPGY